MPRSRLQFGRRERGNDDARADPRRPDDPRGTAPWAFRRTPCLLRRRCFLLSRRSQRRLPRAPPAAAEKTKTVPLLAADEKPVVVHPADSPRFPGRTRVFYRIAAGDTLRDIAELLPSHARRACALEPARYFGAPARRDVLAGVRKGRTNIGRSNIWPNRTCVASRSAATISLLISRRSAAANAPPSSSRTAKPGKGSPSAST